jgi:chloramphenicol O-acetyltransferase type A
MSIHHAVADGFHLSRFFNELQEMVDSFGNSGENI